MKLRGDGCRSRQASEAPASRRPRRRPPRSSEPPANSRTSRARVGANVLLDFHRSQEGGGGGLADHPQRLRPGRPPGSPRPSRAISVWTWKSQAIGLAGWRLWRARVSTHRLAVAARPSRQSEGSAIESCKPDPPPTKRRGVARPRGAGRSPGARPTAVLGLIAGLALLAVLYRRPVARHQVPSSRLPRQGGSAVRSPGATGPGKAPRGSRPTRASSACGDQARNRPVRPAGQLALRTGSTPSTSSAAWFPRGFSITSVTRPRSAPPAAPEGAATTSMRNPHRCKRQGPRGRPPTPPGTVPTSHAGPAAPRDQSNPSRLGRSIASPDGRLSAPSQLQSSTKRPSAEPASTTSTGSCPSSYPPTPPSSTWQIGLRRALPAFHCDDSCRRVTTPGSFPSTRGAKGGARRMTSRDRIVVSLSVVSTRRLARCGLVPWARRARGGEKKKRRSLDARVNAANAQLSNRRSELASARGAGGAP